MSETLVAPHQVITQLKLSYEPIALNSEFFFPSLHLNRNKTMVHVVWIEAKEATQFWVQEGPTCLFHMYSMQVKSQLDNQTI